MVQFFIFKYKMITANDHFLIINLGRNTMGDDIFHLGVKLFMDKTFVFRRLNHGFSPWNVENVLPGRQPRGEVHPPSHR